MEYDTINTEVPEQKIAVNKRKGATADLRVISRFPGELITAKDRVGPYLAVRRSKLVIRNRSGHQIYIRITTREGKLILQNGFRRIKRFVLPSGEYTLEAWLKASHISCCADYPGILEKETIPNRESQRYRALYLRLLLNGKKTVLQFNREVTVGDIISGVL